LRGELSKAELNRIYGIRGESSISKWTRQYSGEEGYDKRSKVLKKNESLRHESEQTKHILELEELLRLERLKVTLNNTMIDIAEEEFKNHKIKMGIDKFFDLLRSTGLLMSRKQRKVRTTLAIIISTNIQILSKILQLINQVIVSDITYI